MAKKLSYKFFSEGVKFGYSLKESANYENIQLNSGACFGSLFRSLSYDSLNDLLKVAIEFDIIPYIDIDEELITNYCTSKGICVLDKKDIITHLDRLKIFSEIGLKYDYEVEFIDLPNEIGYTCRLLVTFERGCTSRFIRYSLTWIRYMFEFPFNFFVRDSYDLIKQSEKLTINDIENIYILVSSHYSYWSSLHSINRPGSNILDLNKLKAKLLVVNEVTLNDIYGPAVVHINSLGSAINIFSWSDCLDQEKQNRRYSQYKNSAELFNLEV